MCSSVCAGRFGFVMAWVVAAAGLLLAGAPLAGCNCGETRDNTIVVGTNALYAPMEFVNEAGEIVGFDIDLMRAVAERAGFAVRFRNMSFDALIVAVQAREIDAAISSMTITPERAQRVRFSEPYFVASQIVAVRENETEIREYDDLRGRTVGVQQSTTGHEMARQLYPDAEGAQQQFIRAYRDIPLAFQALQQGSVDAVLNDEPVSKALAPRYGAKLVGERLSTEHYGIAVAIDNEDLQRKINEALVELKEDGTIDRLMAKWFDPQRQGAVSDE